MTRKAEKNETRPTRRTTEVQVECLPHFMQWIQDRIKLRSTRKLAACLDVPPFTAAAWKSGEVGRLAKKSREKLQPAWDAYMKALFGGRLEVAVDLSGNHCSCTVDGKAVTLPQAIDMLRIYQRETEEIHGADFFANRRK